MYWKANIGARIAGINRGFTGNQSAMYRAVDALNLNPTPATKQDKLNATGAGSRQIFPHKMIDNHFLTTFDPHKCKKRPFFIAVCFLSFI